ncbi:aminoglycoside phosphotransferase family protein [Dinoroseobacter sp. S76]|uniref:aminoglycoside phosphotransferase family protein n=1 Tax=Dinoroseobacter sp. S76 TaxID=3415124 RepID=UPI003C7BC0D2
MTARQEDKEAFLRETGWRGEPLRPLAGDASNRRYDRLTLDARPVVLMDAPPDTGGSIEPFLDVAAHLEGLDLHPPAILAQDRAKGFLLLEDLGDGLYARIFEATPDQEIPLYREALSVLRHLHRAPPPPLPDYGAAEMAAAIDLAPIWYADAPDHAAPLAESLLQALETLDWSRKVVALRDFHAENLIWCPREAGLRRVGLLDFQDAVLSHPLYDVASLFHDARRDVPEPVVETLRQEVFHWFAEDLATFDRAIAILSAQRALRILGIFARLSLHFGKPGYVDLIPRVWTQLEINLQHPSLAEVAQLVAETLPKPSPAHLDDLKARSGTCPMP